MATKNNKLYRVTAKLWHYKKGMTKLLTTYRWADNEGHARSWAVNGWTQGLKAPYRYFKVAIDSDGNKMIKAELIDTRF